MAGIQIGLDKLYYAKLISDDDSGAVYENPIALPGVITAKISFNSGTTVLYADDGAAESASFVGEGSVEVNIKDLTLRQRADLLGHTITGGVLQERTSDTPPKIALGFRTKKSNGKYRYVWLLKGQFAVPDEDVKTRGDKVEFQTPTLKASFLRRDYDGMYRKMIDEDDQDFVQSLADNWFLAVEGIADTTAPNVNSTTPANNAANVAVNATFVWVFSEAVLPSTVNASNFFLVKDSDGSAVSGTLTQSADKTTVTFTPSSNLTATTAYRAIATTGVKDYAGNSLAAGNVRKFTTV